MGTVTKVELNTKARNPAYKIWADFGPKRGIMQSSAQLVSNYTPEDLVGKRICGVLNLPVRRIAGFKSEFLCMGFLDEQDNVVVATLDGSGAPVANGAHVM